MGQHPRMGWRWRHRSNVAEGSRTNRGNGPGRLRPSRETSAPTTKRPRRRLVLLPKSRSQSSSNRKLGPFSSLDTVRLPRRELATDGRTKVQKYDLSRLLYKTLPKGNAFRLYSEAHVPLPHDKRRHATHHRRGPGRNVS